MAEYITDVAYPSRFYDFQSPVLLSYVSALNGFPPGPCGGTFRYCELGCGGGVTLVTLAGAHPEAEFLGVDINPAHVASARALAARGEVGNVELLAASFADLERLDPGEFDYVALHGVYSWVTAEVRGQIRRFLARHLRPGGLLLVSYNALPGSLLLQPLRDALLAHTEALASDSVARIREGLRYLRVLRDGGAEYFAIDPDLAHGLDQVASSDFEFLAHEFLNSAWNPMYFADVAAELATAGLSFAGGLPVATNYLDLCIPEDHRDLFRRAPGRIAAEANKALVLNERFRRDVFVRAAGPALPEAERLASFAGLRFGCRVAAPAAEVTVRVGRRSSTLAYREPIYAPLRAALSGRTLALADLIEWPGLQGFAPQAVLDALHMLVLGGEFRPAAGPVASPLRVPAALNRVLLERALAAGEAAYLASPALGDGVGLAAVDALLLAALGEVGAEGAVTWSERQLEAGERSLCREGVPIEPGAPLTQALAERLGELVRVTLPKLSELGVLPAG